MQDALTQVGPQGIRFDFNDGARVTLPEGRWRVRLSDRDTGNVLYETIIGAGMVASAKHYFIRFRIEVWCEEELILAHDLDLSGRDVLVKLPVDSLGDTIGWFGYVAKFQRLHGCRLTCAMSQRLIPLFAPRYPHIAFVPHDAIPPLTPYATYTPILYFNDVDHRYQPCDYQFVGLHRNAAYILGVDPAEEPPLVAGLDNPRPIAEPYVCIATQSTAQCKYWNNPDGWRQVVAFLKAAGYRVICIDQKPVHGEGLVWNHIPEGAEDLTGDRPLAERATWLRHASLFVGLSSGLSWLAWAAGTPIVLISGFTAPLNEFHTPYRVINFHTCNSCFNDIKLPYDRTNFLWCPRHANTPRQFECTRLITATAVQQAIARVPGFGEGKEARRGALPPRPPPKAEPLETIT